MLKSVLKRALGLGTAVVEGARIEGESTIVSARPRRAALRCPACGRRCDGHDTLPARRWRAPDVGSARCYVEYAPRRVERPRRGGERQDQGGGQAGLRVQEHRQPDSARDAQVLGPQARATRQGGGVTPTHANSRSLLFPPVFSWAAARPLGAIVRHRR